MKKSNTDNKSSRKPFSGKKVVGLVAVALIIVGMIGGIRATVAWAGSGYDYNGNEVKRALPVIANKGANSSVGYATGNSDAHVIVTDNSDNNEKPSEPGSDNDNGGSNDNTSNPNGDNNGAVNVSPQTQYPQTGDQNEVGLVAIGLSMLIAIAVVYRKKFVAQVTE